MTSSASSATIRKAGPADIARVDALDVEAAAQPGTAFVRAMRGELEAGIVAGDVWVADFDGHVVGYAHLDRQARDRLYLAGSAVSPPFRRRGIGAALMAEALKQAERSPLPLCAVTSPRNQIMLGMLFSHRFVARWPLHDFFGPSQHRVGCQRLPGNRTIPLTWRAAEDANAWADVFSSGYGVMAVDSVGTRPLVGVAPLSALDLAPCTPPDYPDRPVNSAVAPALKSWEDQPPMPQSK